MNAFKVKLKPIQIVVVLYKIKLADSVTLQTLSKIKSQLTKYTSLLLFENATNSKQTNSSVLKKLIAKYQNVKYQYTYENSGIVKAYNLAYQQIVDTTTNWLLLLDQDTSISTDYFDEISNFISISPQNNIILVPRLSTGKHIFAPTRDILKRRPLTCGSYKLNPHGYFSTVNSGMLISKQFLDSIHGFNNKFWLDGLDHWICSKLREKSAHVQVSNAILVHELSVNSSDGISIQRLQNILHAEQLLWFESYNFTYKLIYFFSLLYRIIKYCAAKKWHFALLLIKQLIWVATKRKNHG
jgi:GT2 family glycosyltransferase